MILSAYQTDSGADGVNAANSPLTPHPSLLTPHPSLLTPHSSPLTPHSSLLTPHPSPLTPHSSPLTPHPSLLTPHPSLLTPHPSLLTTDSGANGVQLSAKALAAACAAVQSGQLIGLPTETVYGLGADADNASAVAAIFQAKGRPSEHPLIVHVAALDGGRSGVAHYAQQVPDFAQALMAAFWPGPLTLILPRKPGVGATAAGGQNTIGLRCPAHPVAQALLTALRHSSSCSSTETSSDSSGSSYDSSYDSSSSGAAMRVGNNVVWGIAAPSANRFGRVSPTTALHVAAEFAALPDLLILDAGPCAVGIESTIIDCTRGTPVLLRPGSISARQIEAACGRTLATAQDLQAQGQPAPRASGTLQSHYAPKARVRLMDAKTLQQALDLLGPTPGSATTTTAAADNSNPANPAPRIALYTRTPLKTRARSIIQRHMPSTPAAAAHELFAVLRELDALQVQLIWIETPPPTSAWDGIRDRLQRAAA